MEEFLIRQLDEFLDRAGRALRRISPSSPWFTSPWFGACASLTAYSIFAAFERSFQPTSEGALPVAAIFGGAGVVAGFFLRKRVRIAVDRERWRMPLLGIGVALLTLELVVLGIVSWLLVAEPEPVSLGVLPVAMVGAAVLCLPVLLFGGTLSGLSLWGVATLLDRRNTAEQPV